MGGRGIDFLENWVSKNVTAADLIGSQTRANMPGVASRVPDGRSRRNCMVWVVGSAVGNSVNRIGTIHFCAAPGNSTLIACGAVADKFAVCGIVAVTRNSAGS